MTDEALGTDAFVRSGHVDASCVLRACILPAALVHVDATMSWVHLITRLASALETTLRVHALRVRAARRALLALVYIC